MDAMEKVMPPAIPDLSEAVEALRDVEPVSILDKQRTLAHEASKHAAGLSTEFEHRTMDRAKKKGMSPANQTARKSSGFIPS